MDFIKEALDFVLHPDLKLLISQYGVYIYAILFLIIFVETGVVVMPFLPGDSLLFTAGLLAATGDLNIVFLMGLLFIAAFLGDTANYLIGKFFGNKAMEIKFRQKQLVKPEYIQKTHEFYEKHGPKTIILARFVPIVRTFAPFVAGVGSMTYGTFITYNIVGGLLWVSSMTLLGYFLGEIKFVEENLEKFVLGIVFVSILPIIFEGIKAKMNAKKA
jgi:membrane-associated protein